MRRSHVFSSLMVVCLVTVPCAGQTAVQQRTYDSKKAKLLLAASKRHYELGKRCRNLGLVTQATAQFLRSQEIADGHSPHAEAVVQVMRRYGPLFWKGERKRPSKRVLRGYENDARSLEKRNRKERFQLAKVAAKLGLREEAQRLYTLLVRESGDATNNKDGSIAVDGGTIPAKYAVAFEKEEVKVNERARPRDAFLAEAGDIGPLFEVADETLRVRTEVSLEQAQDLHALGTALLPHLEERLEGMPTRRLEVFVFKSQAAFQAHLQRLGFGNSGAHGYMDPGTFTALTFAEGHGEDDLHAVVLHELAHLFDFGIAPIPLPSWYAEGFAESFGGHGTFTWEGGILRLGLPMPVHRLDQLRQTGGLPLADLLRLDGMGVLATSKERALSFYAQSWAFLRFLREGAGDDVAADLRAWELQIRGAGLGAVPGNPRARGMGEAQAAFAQRFGARLPALEEQFWEWLRGV